MARRLLRGLAASARSGSVEMLEARRVQLVESANRLANMRRLSEAYQREMDPAVGGSPAPEGPSRIGSIRQCGATIASMFGTYRPVYATPAENIRAAQVAADELDKLEGEEHRLMTERIQRHIDAAAEPATIRRYLAGHLWPSSWRSCTMRTSR